MDLVGGEVGLRIMQSNVILNSEDIFILRSWCEYAKTHTYLLHKTRLVKVGNREH